MAEGKKAFIVYTDWLKYTDLMTNEQKGMWIDWCLKYCNDLNPIYPDDSMVKMLCVMCQDILKRDLKKYENKVVSIQNAREKRKCNIENNNEINIENNNDINIASSGVNSNKLIVNSNKYISNDILKEKENMGTLQQLIVEIEEMNGRILTPKESTQVVKIFNDYGYKTALYEIKKNADKDNPIAYTYKCLYNIVQPKNEAPKSSGSEWWDKTKRELEEQDKGSEWLANFKKQMEDKQ